VASRQELQTASPSHPQPRGKRNKDVCAPLLAGWLAGWLVGWLADWLACSHPSYTIQDILLRE